MKQGMIFILLIATIGVVGYTLYRYTKPSGGHISSGTLATPQTMQVLTTPTVVMGVPAVVTVVVLPNTSAEPARLPDTGGIDASTVWVDTPLVVLMAGLFITSSLFIWLGRRN